MNDICFNIRKFREYRGYTQEFMAEKMGVTQPTYARMENQVTDLKLTQLQQIAEILETDPATFLNASKLTIQTQTNHEGAYGNGYIENLHVENKETVKAHIKALNEEIVHLKTEIEFLRNLVKKDYPK